MGTERLDCELYTHAPADLSMRKLAEMLAAALSGSVSGPEFAPVVETGTGQIELRRNAALDPDRAAEFPDGFLYFSQCWEFAPRPGADTQDCVATVGRALSWCWSQGWPAVAACDYEELLPRSGGYKDPETSSAGGKAGQQMVR